MRRIRAMPSTAPVEQQPIPELRNETSKRFSKALARITSLDITAWNFDELLVQANVDKSHLNKAGSTIVTLWVLFLNAVRSKCNLKLKYNTPEVFLAAYDGRFTTYAPDSVATLQDTANWMHVLFQFLPAEKNKGLALAVVPKVVEGWDAKYVTGSGQTQGTADRVLIYEKESGLRGVPKRRKIGGTMREVASPTTPRRAKQQQPPPRREKPSLQVTIPDSEKRSYLRSPRAVSAAIISPTAEEVTRKRKVVEQLSPHPAGADPEVVKTLQEEVKVLNHQVQSLGRELKVLKGTVKSNQLVTQRDTDSLRDTNIKLQAQQDQMSRNIADWMSYGTGMHTTGSTSDMSLSVPSGGSNFFNGQLFSAEELMQQPLRGLSPKESKSSDLNVINGEGGSQQGSQQGFQQGSSSSQQEQLVGDNRCSEMMAPAPPPEAANYSQEPVVYANKAADSFKTLPAGLTF